MKIIDPTVYIPAEEISSDKILKIERYGRICYKSEGMISPGSAEKFIRNIINSGHESVIEHEKATVLAIIDRGVSHELVRHRISSFSQESTRYCNYSKEKFGNEITVVRPFFYNDRELMYETWKKSCKSSEDSYFKLLINGQPQEARSVLPNSLKTEIIVTFNFREWRHFFKLRCAQNAHPQMRQIAIPLLLKFKEYLPCLFEDIAYDPNFPVNDYAKISITDKYFKPSIK